MTLTKHKKKIRDERKKVNPKQLCLDCKKKIKKSCHHFYCNDCYVEHGIPPTVRKYVKILVAERTRMARA